MSGKCIIITGPSAAGKTRLVSELLQSIPNSARLITVTTRAPREGEKSGKDYYFVSREEFEQRLAEDKFFEHVEVYGNLYGSSKKVLDEFLATYDFVFAVIDVQGARTLKEKMPGATTIFLKPGSLEDIKRRLEGERMDIPEDEMEKRLRIAKEEMEQAEQFDILVENIDGQFDATLQETRDILDSLG